MFWKDHAGSGLGVPRGAVAWSVGACASILVGDDEGLKQGLGHGDGVKISNSAISLGGGYPPHLSEMHCS